MRTPLFAVNPYGAMTSTSPAYSPPPAGRLDFHYIDAALLVVHKPSGLLSVPGRGAEKQDSLVARVQAQFPGARSVHRLDMGTSGLLVLALDADIQRELGRQFEFRQVEKCYVAVVAGHVAQEECLIDLPLIADWPNRPRQMVDHVRGKPSLTRLKVLGYDQASDTTRVHLMPETGRSHQLRVHMQAIGHPILGDELYAPLPIVEQAPRLLLHASFLAFSHPWTLTRLAINSPPPF